MYGSNKKITQHKFHAVSSPVQPCKCFLLSIIDKKRINVDALLRMYWIATIFLNAPWEGK